MSNSPQRKGAGILASVAIVAVVTIVAPITAAATGAAKDLVPSAGMSVTLRYDASLKTPKKSTASGATIKLAALGNHMVRVEVHPDDGTPSRTVDLALGSDGSLGGGATSGDAAGTSDPAKMLLSDLELAAQIAGAIKKSTPNEAVGVPVTLEPIGQGMPVTTDAQLIPSHPTMDVTTYSGSAQGQTTAVLPPGAGGAALALKAQVHAGRISTIAGTQTNSIHRQGQATDVVSTWTFTSLR